MPKGPKGEKRPGDVIGAAIKVAKIATGEELEERDDTGKSKAAGVSDTLHDMEWIVGLIDARAPKPGRRGPYKKRV